MKTIGQTFRLALVLTVLASVSAIASAQSSGSPSFGNITGGVGKGFPSYGAAVAGAAVGVAAGTGLVLYLVLHKPSITGCVRSVDGANTLTDENDKLNYTLTGEDSGLKAGERVKLLGKKRKHKDGDLSFQVKELKRDYGSCGQ